MKLKTKLACLLMVMSLSVPTFATVSIEDTFTYENILNTIVNISNNYYAITSDNTVVANGTSVHGVEYSSVNTNGKWLHTIKSDSGSILNNIVKLGGSFYYTYALDTEGVLYYLESFVKKVDVGVGIKIRDVGEVHLKNTTTKKDTSKVYLVDDNGFLYTGNNTSFTRSFGISGVEHLVTTDLSTGGDNRYNYGLAITKDNEVYSLSAEGDVKKVSTISNVKKVFPVGTTFCVEHLNGTLSIVNTNGVVVKTITFPDDEVFLGIFWYTSGYNCLITDKNIYNYSGSSKNIEKYECVNTANSEKIKPVAIRGNFVIDEKGVYYTKDTSDMSRFGFKPVDGTDSWRNSTNIVYTNSLCNFEIPSNTILNRLESHSFDFNLVSKTKPTAFNIYYAKSEDVGTKSSWKLIESSVPESRLYQGLYETGKTDSDGIPVTGAKYLYNWSLSSSLSDNLTGIHLVVEPIY